MIQGHSFLCCGSAQVNAGVNRSRQTHVDVCCHPHCCGRWCYPGRSSTLICVRCGCSSTWSRSLIRRICRYVFTRVHPNTGSSQDPRSVCLDAPNWSIVCYDQCNICVRRYRTPLPSQKEELHDAASGDSFLHAWKRIIDFVFNKNRMSKRRLTVRAKQKKKPRQRRAKRVWVCV